MRKLLITAHTPADLYPGRAHPHAVRRRTRTGRSVPADGKQERVEDQTIGLASGRTVGFADYGIADATAVLWCHGGPGSRLEPAYLRRAAGEAGLRIIGIDRPGYGLSAPQPGRTIAVLGARGTRGRRSPGYRAVRRGGDLDRRRVRAGARRACPCARARRCRLLLDDRYALAAGQGHDELAPRPCRVGGARPRGGPGCGGRCARRGWQHDAAAEITGVLPASDLALFGDPGG